jgi:hypothetical protein
MRTIRTAILALGLLGAATVSAHAAPSQGIRPVLLTPFLQTAPGNCSVTVNGSIFTPGGVVDLYVYGSDGLYKTYKETAYALTWFGVQAGSFAQTVYDANNATTIQAIAYNESTQHWSNWSSSTEYCLK